MSYYYYSPQQRLLRWLVALLVIAVVVLGVISISQCSNNQTDEDFTWYDWDDTTYDEDPLPIPQPPQYPKLRSQLASDLSNSASVSVYPGESFRDALRRCRPVLSQLDDEGLGGSKLLGEMNADANGNKRSSSPGGEDLPIRSLDDLGVGVDNSDDGLPARMANDEVKATPSRVRAEGILFPHFVVVITIQNLKGYELDVSIRQGLLLEAVNAYVQNIVVKESITVTLRAYESKSVVVTAYCASQFRESPVGSEVRITPFYLYASSSVYASQESLWRWQSDRYAVYRANNNSGLNW